ncbi:MAG: hypothetical protein CL828_06470 [Crocinitomicaceae bacterium]|nr:hypothetical protein [Crocinitomicaceae bacterium]
MFIWVTALSQQDSYCHCEPNHRGTNDKLIAVKTQLNFFECVGEEHLTTLMKHYRIHIDIHKFEQIYLHRHRFDVNLFEYCLN